MKHLIKLFIPFLFLSGCEVSNENAQSIYSSSSNVNSAITGYGNSSKSYVATYYVDVTGGDDINGDGSAVSPWMSISNALSNVSPGNKIILKNGNHGKLSINNCANNSGEWTLIESENPKGAVITNLEINNPSLQNCYIKINNLTINSNSSNTSALVYINNAKNIEVTNNTIENTHNKYTADSGIKINMSEQVLIQKNTLRRAARGISTSNSNKITISQNKIHELGGGSGIQYAGNNSNFIIELNNIFDSNFDSNDTYAPSDPHGSAISVRSNNVYIRKNIFHDIGSSAGIMFYTPDAAGGMSAYSNIHIENNVFYDIHNLSVIRIYNLGDNVSIRNNTIIGHYRTDTSNALYKLGQGILVQSTSNSHDGSGLSVINNIVAGSSTLPENAYVRNNIFWSLAKMEDMFNFIDSTITQDSKVLTITSTNYPINYFSSNFFNSISTSDIFLEKHGQSYSFVLDSLSEAVNFGNSSLQVTGSMGSIDGAGFINDNGSLRTQSTHSAGAYEL